MHSYVHERGTPPPGIRLRYVLSCLQDRPGIVTGWWQQSTIDKFRMLTLEGLSSVVKFKKEQLAAAAAAAAEVRKPIWDRRCEAHEYVVAYLVADPRVM